MLLGDHGGAENPGQMKWVQLMNQAKAEAEHHIVQEIIFEYVHKTWSQ